ncbi:MAG: hypothetical protein QGG09_02355, partial [Pirellulaceae bacterium]|nr:hypothetical protein [Pirellulaceae bacterium]
FILGLPVGLWSLAVLSRSDVKTAFRQYAAGELGTRRKDFDTPPLSHAAPTVNRKEEPVTSI